MKKWIEKIRSSKYIYSVLALILMMVISGLLSPSFFRTSNLMTILRQASILLVLSTGLTAVVLTGGIDLSVGSVAGLVGCVCAKLMTSGVSVGQAMVLGLLVAAAVGIFNGFLVGVLKLPAFVATYGTNWVVTGIATIIMRGQVIYGLPEGFTYLGVGYIGKLAVPIVLSVIGVILLLLILTKTTYGRNIYMIGANPEAARYSGTGVLTSLFGTYTICSIFAGIGGIIMCARLNAADVAMCDAYGLQIVAAVVIGGTSLLGGEGGILGTVIGAVILTMIVNVMNLVGLSSYLQGIAIGLVILIMVYIDIFSRKRSATVNKKNNKAAGRQSENI